MRETIGVYLDTNVLLDMVAALDGTWHPPSEMSRSDHQCVAAARIRFYGYRDRCGWWPVTSRVALDEVLVKAPNDWLSGFMFLVDDASDAPSESTVNDLAQTYVAEANLTPPDALHLVHVALRSWVKVLVTNDNTFRSRARRVDIPGLEILSATDAEAALGIAPSEHPPVTPSPGSPLANSDWSWIVP